MFQQILFSLISFIFFSTNFSGSFFTLLGDNFSSPYFQAGEIVNLEESFYQQKQLLLESYPQLSASSAVIMDLGDKSFLYEKESQEAWPIASISKMMSALVLLEDFDIDWESYYQFKNSDHRDGGRDHLFPGDELRLIDLLALALISSENSSVIAMISSQDLNEEDFVVLMNEKAKKMGLKKTFFFDATGLSSKNISTAQEVALIIEKALEQDKIRDLSSLYNYSFTTKQGRSREVRATNELLGPQYDFSKNNIKIIGGKTGYNDFSGYCLALRFDLNNKEKYVTVVLNAPSPKNRFLDTEKLFDILVNYINN